jgi:hypothetical protein
MSANNAPMAEDLQWLLAWVTALQNKLAALRQQNQPQQNQLNPVIFADTPQTLEVENLIDYGTKRGTEIYKQGCAPLDHKSLTDGFNMTPDQTVTFIETLQRHCTKMGWNYGTKNITSFQNKDNVTVNIIKTMGKLMKRLFAPHANVSARLLGPTPGQEQSRTKQ